MVPWFPIRYILPADKANHTYERMQNNVHKYTIFRRRRANPLPHELFATGRRVVNHLGPAQAYAAQALCKNLDQPAMTFPGSRLRGALCGSSATTHRACLPQARDGSSAPSPPSCRRPDRTRNFLLHPVSGYLNLGRRRWQEVDVVFGGELDHLLGILLLHIVDRPEQVIEPASRRHPEQRFRRLL
jgi:hypothetical protein